MNPILVLGRTGQLGTELVLAGRAQNLEVLAPDHRQMALFDPIRLSEELRRLAPLVVVNAIAYNDVDRAESEPEIAIRINRDLPANIAKACLQARIRMIHVSSDYVFDGQKRQPYVESDPTNPLSQYGYSKLEGELRVLEASTDHLVFRTSWLYSEHRRNFVLTMLKLAKTKKEIRVVSDAFGSPTWAKSLAEAIIKTTALPPIPGGLYHVTALGSTSWAGFAEAIFTRANQLHPDWPRPTVIPIAASEYPASARRPSYSVLSGEKFKSASGFQMPKWRDALDQCLSREFIDRLFAN